MMVNQAGHEFISHTADIQVAVWAPTLEQLFRETAVVLARVMVPEPAISIEREIEVITEAEDIKATLFDWLSEVLFYSDAELFVLGDVDVKAVTRLAGGKYRIDSVFKGETFKKGHHVSGREVKAITYSYMEVEEQPTSGMYHLKIIFDI
ncbi:MAG: archease [Candidatus Lokiarchaeota archaeon]|nr:archease [Candidatus Lokiarchaeota archaeon]